jgi:hypothetical protein
MMVGPDIVVQCPSCGAKKRHGTLISGNTFRARFFSDGKMIAPMLPDYPPFVKCHSCAAFYRPSKHDVGTVSSPRDWNKDGATFSEAEANEFPETEFLSIDEYQELLSHGLYGVEEPLVGREVDDVFLARLWLWWTLNDAIRDRGSLPASGDHFSPELQKVYDENCREMISMLDDLDSFHEPTDLFDDPSLLMAELCRNIGEFDKCKRILALSLKIHEACEAGNRYTFELT